MMNDEGGSPPRVGDLIAPINRGDATALVHFMQLHRDTQLRRIRGLLRGAHWGLGRSEDVLQDTIIGAMQSLDGASFESERQVLAWVQAIAANHVYGMARAAKPKRIPRRATAFPVALLQPYTNELNRSGNPIEQQWLGDVLCEREGNRALRRAAAALPSQSRRVILLRDYARASWETVAFLMNRSEGAAQMLHLRARQRLHEQFLAMSRVSGQGGQQLGGFSCSHGRLAR